MEKQGSQSEAHNPKVALLFKSQSIKEKNKCSFILIKWHSTAVWRNVWAHTWDILQKFYENLSYSMKKKKKESTECI